MMMMMCSGHQHEAEAYPEKETAPAELPLQEGTTLGAEYAVEQQEEPSLLEMLYCGIVPRGETYDEAMSRCRLSESAMKKNLTFDAAPSFPLPEALVDDDTAPTLEWWAAIDVGDDDDDDAPSSSLSDEDKANIAAANSELLSFGAETRKRGLSDDASHGTTSPRPRTSTSLSMPGFFREIDDDDDE
eukprot:CAMPEP_0118897422 /NCGR_PEP_ID=MMETSP1166-20130328/4824_1 /TAXON_ID=1104430 /ORGANISM="Chrysoreinhardia sp, Strain CCMP3193" /LENGTH=186 /DNA_ID=CAMNT_0006836491 /DNA_START=114 /DNA_END=674 /DNA_ORIENTATION=-